MEKNMEKKLFKRMTYFNVIEIGEEAPFLDHYHDTF